VDVSANDQTAFARLVNGTVISWGFNTFGFLGIARDQTVVDSVPPPGQPVLSLNAAQVVAGFTNICAIPAVNRRSVVCWGGGSPEIDSPTGVPLTLAPGLEVKSLVSGVHANAPCVIVSDGSLQCMVGGAGGAFAPITAVW
jgi:hypothetical protein